MMALTWDRCPDGPYMDEKSINSSRQSQYGHAEGSLPLENLVVTHILGHHRSTLAKPVVELVEVGRICTRVEGG